LTSRIALESAIKKLIDGHAASHKVIDLNRAALAILNRYPDCGLSIEEIQQEIEKEQSKARPFFQSGETRSDDSWCLLQTERVKAARRDRRNPDNADVFRLRDGAHRPDKSGKHVWRSPIAAVWG